MTDLGRFLRKLRIDYDEILYDMAQKLSVSTSFLSAVENGRKCPPPEWVDRISSYYNLEQKQRNELESAVHKTINQIRLNISNQPSERRDLAIAFARKFDSMSDEDAADLLRILNRQSNGQEG